MPFFTKINANNPDSATVDPDFAITLESISDFVENLFEIGADRERIVEEVELFILVNAFRVSGEIQDTVLYGLIEELLEAIWNSHPIEQFLHESILRYKLGGATIFRANP
jgi:hypothetical protein